MERPLVAVRVLTSLCACTAIQALLLIVLESNGANIPQEYLDMPFESGYCEERPVTEYIEYIEYPEDGETEVYQVIPAGASTAWDYSGQSNTEAESEPTEDGYAAGTQTGPNNAGREGTTCDYSTTQRCQGQNNDLGAYANQGGNQGQCQGQTANAVAYQNAGADFGYNQNQQG